MECRWITFEYLPAYCPELNPVEHVWGTTKWGSLANWPAPNIEAVHHRVDENLQLQASQQETLRGHFQWAGLDLNQVRFFVQCLIIRIRRPQYLTILKVKLFKSLIVHGSSLANLRGWFAS
ncbi:transposase [Novipirellula sp.]|uniref:transposase n=1 Tax=Novipirellula sp. TaxID=2795430 RepID=UPI0035627F22